MDVHRAWPLGRLGDELAVACDPGVAHRAVYGVLRAEGVAPLAALFGAYLVASLPLLDVHAALAGYADLPMGAVYLLAATATYRWCQRRDPRDGIVALGLALACPLIKTPGLVWALTLLPGVVVALMPRRGLRLLGICAALRRVPAAGRRPHRTGDPRLPPSPRLCPGVEGVGASPIS